MLVDMEMRKNQICKNSNGQIVCALETVTLYFVYNGDNCIPASILLCPISWVHYSILCCIHIYKKDSFIFLHCFLLSNAINSTLSHTILCPVALVCLKSALFSSWFRMHLSIYLSIYLSKQKIKELLCS